MPSEVAIIAAVALNGVIGRDNALPWRLPGDLAHFKRLTLGHTIVIGRRTHESIGRALPGRRTIVVTGRALDGVETAASLGAALFGVEGRVFLAGGAAIYAQGLRIADTLHITRVEAEPAGDTRFPDIPRTFRLVATARGARTPRDEHGFSHETWQRAPFD